MSDEALPEVAEMATEDRTADHQLPADHPLVKTLAAQKAQIKELKVRAARADEYEESQKSEAEKMADRLAKADAAEAAIPARVCEALRPYLVELGGVDPDDAEVLLTATDPELLMTQFRRLEARSGKRKNIVPREGATPPAEPVSDMRDFARNLFGTNQ